MYSNINKGFLDFKISDVREKYRKKYIKEYETIYAMNNLAYQIIKNSELKTTPLETFVLTDFVLIHNSFQSSIVLLEMGLYEDSRNIARSIYEKLLNLKYIINNEYGLNMFQKKQDSEMLRTFNYIKTNKLYKIVSEETILKYIEQLQSKIDKKSAKYPSIKLMFELFNMKDEYVFYKILCNYVHSSVSTILPRLDVGDDKTIINNGIMYGSSNFELAEIIRCFNLALFEILNFIRNSEFDKKYLEIQNIIRDI